MENLFNQHPAVTWNPLTKLTSIQRIRGYVAKHNLLLLNIITQKNALSDKFRYMTQNISFYLIKREKNIYYVCLKTRLFYYK